MMNFLQKTLVAGMIGLMAQASSAQQITNILVDVDEPKFEDLKSPDFAANTKTKQWKQKDWLEIEVKFKIKDAKPKIPKDKTLPVLTIKWFVVAEDPIIGKKKYIRLQKEVKHVNIPFNEDVYSSVYISPSGVRRLSGGGDRADKRIFWGVGGEIVFDGKVRARFTSNKKKTADGKPFWTSAQLSDSHSVQLHDKSETPFKFFWWDRYAEIESDSNKAAK